MGMSAGSILRNTVAGISLLAHCLILLRALWRAPLRALIRDACAAAARGLRSLVRPPKTKRSEIDAVVDEKIERQTLERALRFNQTASLIFLLVCPIELHRRATTGEPGEFTAEQATCGFACYAIMLLGQAPAIASRMRLVKAFSAVIWLLIVVATSPWAAKPDIVQTPLFVAFVNIGIMLCNIGMPSLMLSGVGTACSVVSLSSCYYAQLPETALSFSAFQAAAGICSVCLAFVLRKSLHSQTRATVEAAATRVAHEAACALLMSFCDVVVDLDAEGRILGDGGSTISGFLLQGRSLQGTHIQDLVSDPDGRASLLEKLRAPRRDEGSLAELIHVRMRDGNGVALPMQLFWFAYNGVDGQFRCMVGLRKFADGDPTERAAAREQGGAPADQPVEDNLGEREVCVVVDTSDPNLPVEYQSPGFGMNVFHLPHAARLCDYLEKGIDFGFWLQGAVYRQQQRQQQQPEQQQPPKTRVCFRTRGGRVTATAILATQPEATLGTGAGQPPNALVLFEDIRRRAVFTEQRGLIEIDRLSRISSGGGSGKSGRSLGGEGDAADMEARSEGGGRPRRPREGSPAGGRGSRGDGRAESGQVGQPALEVSPERLEAGSGEGIQIIASAQL